MDELSRTLKEAEVDELPLGLQEPMMVLDLDAFVEAVDAVVHNDGRSRRNSSYRLSERHEVERALRRWAELALMAHGPLLNIDPGAAGDFGVRAFLDEAQHVSTDRVVLALKEAFVAAARGFELFRTSPEAPVPDPTAAIAKAIASSLRPLAAEQQTQPFRSSTYVARDRIARCRQPWARGSRRWPRRG